MLVYLLVVYVGFIFIGVIVDNLVGFFVMLFYLVVYSFSMMGVFVIVGLV